MQGADITLSPTYSVGADLIAADGGGRGLSLRFPRFLRERADKPPEAATSAKQIAELYWLQNRRVGVGGGA